MEETDKHISSHIVEHNNCLFIYHIIEMLANHILKILKLFCVSIMWPNNLFYKRRFFHQKYWFCWIDSVKLCTHYHMVQLIFGRDVMWNYKVTLSISLAMQKCGLSIFCAKHNLIECCQIWRLYMVIDNYNHAWKLIFIVRRIMSGEKIWCKVKTWGDSTEGNPHAMSITAEIKDPPRIGPYPVKGVGNTSSSCQIKGYQIQYCWFIIYYFKTKFEIKEIL